MRGRRPSLLLLAVGLCCCRRRGCLCHASTSLSCERMSFIRSSISCTPPSGGGLLPFPPCATSSSSPPLAPALRSSALASPSVGTGHLDRSKGGAPSPSTSSHHGSASSTVHRLCSLRCSTLLLSLQSNGMPLSDIRSIAGMPRSCAAACAAAATASRRAAAVAHCPSRDIRFFSPIHYIYDRVVRQESTLTSQEIALPTTCR